MCEKAQNFQELYFDWETTSLDVYTLTPLLLAVQFGQETYVIDCIRVHDWAEIIKSLFENPDILKIAHNFVFDYKILFHNNIEAVPGYCTMVTEQLLTSGLRGLSSSLQAITLRRLREQMDKSVREGFIGRSLEDIHFEDAELRYAARDVQVLPLIKAQQLQEIKQEHMEAVHELEMELLPVTAKMEYAGIDIDPSKIEKAIPAFESVLERASVPIQDMCINAGITDRIVVSKDGYEGVRVSSPPQMLEVFNTLGIKVKSTSAEELIVWDAKWAEKQKKERYRNKAKSGARSPLEDEFAVDFIDDSLIIAQEDVDDADFGYSHPLLRAHGIRTATEKVLNTYLYPLPNHINPVTKKVHPNFNQCGASATGRYSSSNINFQNLIKQDKLALLGLAEHDIRSFFVSGGGYKFIDADFSGIELVILAALSNDEILIEQIQKGDIHSFVGSNLFEIEFTKKMAKEQPYLTFRDVAKTLTYATMYGTSGRNLYRKLAFKLASAGFTMRPEHGDQWIAKWYAMFPKTGALLEKNGNKAVTELYTESVLGRRRHWHPDMLREKYAIFRAMREGKNAPIQSSSADLTKKSELLLSKELDWNEARLVACIHDELIVRVKDEWVEKYIPIVQWAMRTAGEILFPNLPKGLIDADPAVTTYYSK